MSVCGLSNYLQCLHFSCCLTVCEWFYGFDGEWLCSLVVVGLWRSGRHFLFAADLTRVPVGCAAREVKWTVGQARSSFVQYDFRVWNFSELCINCAIRGWNQTRILCQEIVSGENGREPIQGQGSKWRFWQCGMLSMALCVLLIAQNGGSSAACKWREGHIRVGEFRYTVQQGGREFSHVIRWRRKRLPQCKICRVFFVFEMLISGRFCCKVNMAHCVMLIRWRLLTWIIWQFFGCYHSGGFCTKCICHIVKDGGDHHFAPPQMGKYCFGSGGLLRDPANQKWEWNWAWPIRAEDGIKTGWHRPVRIWMS